MKKLLITGLGVAGACAACCAVPLLAPVISGLSIAALAVPGGVAFATEFSGIATLVGIAAGVAACGVLWWARRRRTARACASGPQAVGNPAPLAGAACGCHGSCKGPAGAA